MHASEDTVRRMEHIARVEDRTPSQLASAALNLYLQLNPEAHSALRYVQGLGTADDLARVNHGIARLLLDAQFEIAEQRVVNSMAGRDFDEIQSEEDIIAEANALTSHERTRGSDGTHGTQYAKATRRRKP
jgi:predicted transcriptional regulator